LPWLVAAAAIEHMYGSWRIYHTVYEAWYSPDVPQGAMVRRERAAVWSDKAAAELVCATLNERSNRSTLDSMHDPWVVTDDGEGHGT
jgi:hypothetical protein